MKQENQIFNQIQIYKIKELYSAPQVELLEIKVERGFAASPTSGGTNAPGWTPDTF